MNFKKQNLTIYLILALSIALFVYLQKNIFQSLFYQKKYELDFAQENFKNINKNFYIDEDYHSLKFASFGKIKNYNYAQISYTPINFVFLPEEFPIKKTIEINLTVKGNKNWQISWICDKCPDSQKYNWLDFGNELIDKNYLLVAKFNKTYIYAKENKNWQKEKDVDFWIIKNIKPQSKLAIINNSYDKNKLLNPDYPENSPDKYMYKFTDKNPDFIIANFYQSQGKIWTNISRSFSIQEIPDFKNKKLKFAIKNNKTRIKSNEKKLLANGFFPIQIFNEYKLYSKNQNQKEFTAQNMDNWLKKIADTGKNIYLENENFDTNNIIPKNQIKKQIQESDLAIIKMQKQQNTFIKKINLRIK